MVRRHYVFTGRVQGVGFRMTAVQCARGLDVSGWVRNRPDGSVEMEAQGSPADLKTLLDRLTGYFSEQITHQYVTDRPIEQDEPPLRITH